MCQATVYLDGKEIMQDVMLVEPRPASVRLIAFFEPPRDIAAAIEQIDLIKHRVLLTSTTSDQEGAMDERQKLRVLIPHWIEHNAEHAAEFRRWAENAGDVSANLQAAAEKMAAVNAALQEALDQLGGPRQYTPPDGG